MQGLSAARQAVGMFEKSGTPWLRPPDYYAEMVKSDEHMKRVKAQLMHEQHTLEAAEERCACTTWKRKLRTVPDSQARWASSQACTAQPQSAMHRRKQREGRKFQKAVQAERLKEKAQAKKAGVEALTRLRKQRQKQGFAGTRP